MDWWWFNSVEYCWSIKRKSRYILVYTSNMLSELLVIHLTKWKSDHLNTRSFSLATKPLFVLKKLFVDRFCSVVQNILSESTRTSSGGRWPTVHSIQHKKSLLKIENFLNSFNDQKYELYILRKFVQTAMLLDSHLRLWQCSFDLFSYQNDLIQISFRFWSLKIFLKQSRHSSQCLFTE